MRVSKRTIKGIAAALCGLTVLLSFAGCNAASILSDKDDLLKDYEKSATVEIYNFTSGEAAAPENYQKYTENLTDFSLRLLLSSLKEGENQSVSSLACAHTLSLLLNATGSSTATELKRLIAKNLDLNTLNLCSYYQNSRLTAFNTDTEGYFEEAALWFNDSFSVKATYLQTVKNYYNSHLVRKVLSDSDTAGKINALTSESTKGGISEIVSEPLADTTVLAISAAYLKDSWVTPYTSDRLSEGIFKGTEGEETASFMTSNERYISSDFAEGFIKSLKNTPVKFAAIMPKGDENIEEFISTLSYSRLYSLLMEGSATSFCTATVPEFEVTSTLDLDGILKGLGIEKAYSKESANFSSLSTMSGISLSDFREGSKIAITPAGTEKADTVGEPDTEFSETENKLVFDKPFMFVFFDNESGAPLIMGVINNTKN